MKALIKNYALSDLKDEMRRLSLPAYRAEQIFRGLYVQRAGSFHEMTALPLGLREMFDGMFEIESLSVSRTLDSFDGSSKFIFHLRDGLSIETALMPPKKKNALSACISTQAGCPVGCVFCASGALGFKRNLQAAEIIDQILTLEKLKKVRLTNLVIMGMGEPFLNYENLVKSLRILTEGDTKLFSPRKITLSTVGIPSKIIELADENIGVKLAVSLHATTDGVRKKLMPNAGKWRLKDIFDAAEYYYRKTKNAITYEYILFDGLNDSPDDARRLAGICRRVPSKVNIIPFNEVSFIKNDGAAELPRPTPIEGINEFAGRLKKLGAEVFIRESYGSDIKAACGQLALADAE